MSSLLRHASRAALILLTFALPVVQGAELQGGQRPFTVAAGIETSRAMTDLENKSIFISPDGQRYAVLLIRGDLARDGVVATLLVGHLDSLAAATPRVVAEFFTRGLRRPDLPGAYGPASLVRSGLNPPRWLDNEQVVLNWEDGASVLQVLSVDVNSGVVKQLTWHPTPVISAAVGPGGLVAYAALRGTDKEAAVKRLRQGFAVTSRDALALLAGNVASEVYLDDVQNYDRFIITPKHPVARHIQLTGGAGLAHANASRLPVLFSPNGRWAIVVDTATQAPAEWDRYVIRDQRRRNALQAVRSDPHSVAARYLDQLFVINLETATAKPLWNAPMLEAERWRRGEQRSGLAWSPGGQRLLLGPTVLPLSSAGTLGADGTAVAEVSPETGEFWLLPVNAEDAQRILALRWGSEAVAEIEFEDGHVHIFERSAPGWLHRSTSKATAAKSLGPRSSAIHLAWKQTMNSPPALYGTDVRSRRELLLLDPNPLLRASYSLGLAEIVHWRAPDGRSWTGRLYLPVQYQRDERYPLVVQTYGLPEKGEFSVYGNHPHLGPAYATRLAQQLANRGIAVLQLNGPDGVGHRIASRNDLAMQAAGREAGIEALVTRGIVDGSRVGLEGFSSLGKQVEWTLAFSNFPYAAAIANDYSDDNYVQAILQVADAQSAPGTLPFGRENLNRFLEHSPAFNAQRIRTPLQLIVNGGSGGFRMMLTNWEIFAHLRQLDRPVEMYVVPDMLRGNHELLNPRQLVAVQTRALDWWCFWLRDEVDPSSDKAEQYAQWNILRKRHEQNLAKPHQYGSIRGPLRQSRQENQS